MNALQTYIEYGMAVVFAFAVTGLALFLAVCVGGMLYAIYKGVTDETWR